jgi:predicted nuclease of predicted toxin-antitoxin system
MAISLYMDVHIPQAITDQLRRRGIDVLTAIEDAAQTLPDDQLLERATDLNRVLFTQDIGFRALAEEWQRQSKPFAGLIFAHQLGGTIGQLVTDLELVAQASELKEWLNIVEYVPF